MDETPGVPRLLLEQLGSRYRDVSLYARTGLQELYLAFDGATSRLVNIATLAPAVNDEAALRRRLEYAVGMHGPLNHPNVLPLLDASIDGEVPYYTTPHVDGRWLDARLHATGPLPLSGVVDVVASIARALKYCHDHDVLHCDVKPRSIVVFDTHVALHHFAIAHRISDGRDPLIDEGMTIGTYAFMSPECFTNEAMDPRSDLYSLGVTAYESLCGTLPFPGPAMEDVVRGHLLLPPPVPKFSSSEAQGFFDEIVATLLAKSPDDRFASASELLNALQPWSNTHAPQEDSNEAPLQPYVGDGDYFFVSYCQRDIERVGPLMRRIAAGGHKLWYDRGIPGGAEWDSIIEQKIQSCAGVVLFLSDDAVESKFVRREVKFADSCDKPIVTLRLDDAVLKYGLNMLLTQYQMLDADRVTASDVGIALGYVHQPHDPVAGVLAAPPDQA